MQAHTRISFVSIAVNRRSSTLARAALQRREQSAMRQQFEASVHFER